jgi:hypothetical protein
MYYLDFSGLGAVGFVCSGRQLCLDVAFTSGGGECLRTTGLCFGRLITMSSSVLYGGASWIKVSNIPLGLTVNLSLIWLLDFVSL